MRVIPTIGFIPNSIDFRHPQDRRRYIPYLERAGISYEIADFNRTYEILYISLSGDLNKWATYKSIQAAKGNRVRVIFDLSDLYLVGSVFSDRTRAIFHFVSGRTKTFRSSYKRTVMDMINSTDVLICGSEEQKQFLQSYHNDIVVVRDYFANDITHCKKGWVLKKEGQLNILWEGLSHGNINIFKKLKDILTGVKGGDIHLHVITDPEYCHIGSKYLCKPTYSVLKEVFSGSSVKIHSYDWNPITFSAIATSCDFALIPIPDHPFMMQKPENKLLLFWTMGVPVIATGIKSYARVMKSIDEDFVCDSLNEWHQKIDLLASSTKRRSDYMQAASRYINKYCTEEVYQSAWDYIFFNK